MFTGELMSLCDKLNQKVVMNISEIQLLGYKLSNNDNRNFCFVKLADERDQ
jgi:hypothetical protein